MASYPRITDIFNGMKLKTTTPISLIPGTTPFTDVTRTLPNGGGSYSAPVVAQPTTPVPAKAPAIVTPQAGMQAPTQPTGLDYSKYTDPVTGRVLSPTEYADMLAKRVKGGSIPAYAGDAITGNGMKTSEQMATRGRELNNERNDIATGTTDPYKVGSQSGIAYSPTELAAIEKAYAGIYDPAINDVFAKLEKKQKADAEEADLKKQLAIQAQKHKNDLELKRTPSGDSTINGIGGSGTAYVEGANPNVDAWIERIARGEAKLSDITGVKNQGLKNLVNQGLNSKKARTAASSGNLDTVNTINTLLANPDLNNISGFIGQTGITSLFGKAKTAKTEYDSILGAIQLAKAGQIKGQGAVSDYERGVLKAASAVIDRGQSDEDFKDALIKIKGALTTASGLEAPIRVTNPKTGETVESTGDTEEINELISEGNIVQYIQ